MVQGDRGAGTSSWVLNVEERIQGKGVDPTLEEPTEADKDGLFERLLERSIQPMLPSHLPHSAAEGHK